MRMKQKIGAVKWMPLFPNAGNAALRNTRRKNVWQILVRSDVLSVTTRDTLVRTVVLKVHRGKDQKSSKSKGKGFGKKGKLNEVSEEGHDQSDAWWHELLLGCPYSFLCYGISWRLESFQTGISFHPTLQCGWGAIFKVTLGMFCFVVFRKMATSQNNYISPSRYVVFKLILPPCRSAGYAKRAREQPTWASASRTSPLQLAGGRRG